MVLQREMPVPVWGTAAPNEKVTVTFAGQTESAKAGDDGHWRVTLKPLKASDTPSEMTVSATNTIKFSNVLVGEVWVCSGQSNMEKPLATSKGPNPGSDYPEELKAANYPQIRILNVARNRKPVVLADADIAWAPCSPETLASMHFSAAAYFFGRKIHQELKVPVGLIESSFGGSPIEPWIPKEALSLAPSLADDVELAKKPWVKGTPQLSMMYNSMIGPLIPYAIRGVLWYQGESNVGKLSEVNRYADKMYALIQGWRNAWHEDFPFYYVQIAPFTYFGNGRPGPKDADSPDRLAVFWEQQTDALKIPHTGMIVTTDITDDVHNHHPHDKKSVGERLALWALAKTYGRKDVVYSGPMFKKMEVHGNQADLTFDYADGLMSKDGKPLSYFTIAGKDGKFFPATAKIEGDHVVVSSPEVAMPTTVRFAWDELATPNLANKEGLPAVPFRTDAVPWNIPTSTKTKAPGT